MTCLQNCRNLFDYLVAIGPPFVTSVIAIFLAYVAYQQWKTNENKLKLDLYNRRFEIYSNTITFYQFLSNLPRGEQSEEFKKVRCAFILSYRESQFLFSDKPKIHEILGKIHSDSFKVICLKENGTVLRNSGDHEGLLNMSNDSLAALQNFDSSIKKLEEEMFDYLKFDSNVT